MPARKDKFIIIDTNLWISFLITKDFSKLDKVIAHNSCALLFSKELYEEFISVAQRPKFRRYFSLSDIDNLMHGIQHKTKLIIVSSVVEICRDPKDNFLLSLAKDGMATHLITGDKDLLDIKRIGRTKILTISDFIMKNI